MIVTRKRASYTRTTRYSYFCYSGPRRPYAMALRKAHWVFVSFRTDADPWLNNVEANVCELDSQEFDVIHSLGLIGLFE